MPRFIIDVSERHPEPQASVNRLCRSLRESFELEGARFTGRCEILAVEHSRGLKPAARVGLGGRE